MATIRKRGNLQWEVRVRRKGYPVTCKTFNTKADAEAWARGVENEIDRGVFVSRVESERTTLHEALDRFIAEYIPRYKQTRRETARAKALQQRPIATRIMASIRSKDIADFVKAREAEGVNGNTIRLDLALLSRLFVVALNDWGMEALANPVEMITKPKIPKGRERRLEDGEEKRLLEAANPNLQPVIRFALETAMRRGEIASLTWECVNLRNKSILLPETKNGEARSVPLSPAAMAVLENLPEFRKGSVFRMTADAITQAMEKARLKANLNDLRFHDLRHEATSRFFERTDLDVMEIKTITGHKSLQMLARYSHLRTHKLTDSLAGMKRGA